MAMLKTSIRSCFEVNHSPGGLLEGVHRTLYTLKMPNMFATAAVLQLQPGGRLSDLLTRRTPAVRWLLQWAAGRWMRVSETYPGHAARAAVRNRSTGVILAMCSFSC